LKHGINVGNCHLEDLLLADAGKVVLVAIVAVGADLVVAVVLRVLDDDGSVVVGFDGSHVSHFVDWTMIGAAHDKKKRDSIRTGKRKRVWDRLRREERTKEEGCTRQR
jgi:hypothetical protein